MSDVIQEVQVIKNFLSSLFGKATNKSVQIGSQSAAQEEKQVREIVSKVLAGFDAKPGKVERKRSADTLILRYHVSIGSKKFVMKANLMLESRVLNLSLWTEDQSHLLDILALGDLKSKYRLRAMAKIRLKPWVRG